MPRSTKGPHVAVLEYFRSAPIAVALLVLDLVKDAVKERQAVPATPRTASAQTAMSAVTASLGTAGSAPAKPAGKKRGPKPKAKATKPATAVAAATGKPKGKPGPKPGSHRKKVVEVQPPLDLAEPVGEVEQDPGFEEQLPEQAEEYIEPEAELQTQD